jgi:hypothetical protein
MLPAGGFLLAPVFIPLPVNQYRHSEIHLSLDVQVPVFIAQRHLLARDLFGEFS